MKLKINHILIVVLGLIIVYLSTCRTTPVKIVKEVKHFRDTTILTQIDTFILLKEYHNLEVIHDTVKLSNEPIPTNLDTFISLVNDSLLNATITVYSKDRPFIDFEYRMKHFKVTNTITIKDSVYSKELKSYISAGASLIGSKNYFGFAPQVLYNHKKGSSFGVGYDVINKNYNVTFYRKISFKR